MRREGSSRSEPARRGRLSFARTCIRYLRERILYSVNTNTRRQAKLIVVLLTWLGNAVGVFNECKSSRADSECRFSFFGEAKKSKCPAGMKRMVKTTPKSQPQSSNPFSGCLKRQPHKTIVCRLVKRQQTTIALLVAIDFAQTALKTKSPYQTTPYPPTPKYHLTPPPKSVKWRTSTPAQVAKLVDAGDSKSPAARCVGSSPTLGTKFQNPVPSEQGFFISAQFSPNHLPNRFSGCLWAIIAPF